MGQVQVSGKGREAGDGGLNGVDDLACVLSVQVYVIGKSEKILFRRVLGGGLHCAAHATAGLTVLRVSRTQRTPRSTASAVVPPLQPLTTGIRVAAATFAIQATTVWGSGAAESSIGASLPRRALLEWPSGW